MSPNIDLAETHGMMQPTAATTDPITPRIIDPSIVMPFRSV
jgi:hypothetical protein